MILVDRNIRELVEKNMLIVTGYKPENLGGVSYDVTIDNIITDEGDVEEYVLKPQEFIMIKTNEELKMPNFLVGKIEEKNSLLRTGLFVSGPVYHPGHQTYMFLRVYNFSKKEVILKHDLKIAQIFFELLNEEPEETYDKKKNASFNNEKQYLGYGKYDDLYKSLISE